MASFTAAIAERADGSGQRLEFQRSPHPDEQDRALGLDTYCLVRDGGATHYGGVSHWRIADGSLVLTLDREAEASLGTREFVIRVPPTEQDAIDAALRRLLV